MNKSLKSISYAFVARDIDVYIPDGENDCFITNRLVCSECGEYWHTSLNECYLCGELNYYLYMCKDCGKHYSITHSNTKCICKNEQNQLIKGCINENCPSNTNQNLFDIIAKKGGVFGKDSSFSISLNYCVRCGSTKNRYKSKRIYVWDINNIDSPITLTGFINEHPRN